MTYQTISNLILGSPQWEDSYISKQQNELYIEKPRLENTIYKWLSDPKTKASFAKRELISRVSHLGLMVLSFTTAALDGIIGSVGGIAMILTAGTIKSVNNFTLSYFYSFAFILARPYENLLKTINPQSKNIITLKNKKTIQKAFDILARFFGTIQKLPNSENILKRHVVSRLFWTAGAIAIVTLSIVSVAISTIAATFSLIALGTAGKTNQQAYSGLLFPYNILRLLFCVTKIVNPQSKLRVNVVE